MNHYFGNQFPVSLPALLYVLIAQGMNNLPS
jgi:hypothetical protein